MATVYLEKHIPKMGPHERGTGKDFVFGEKDIEVQTFQAKPEGVEFVVDDSTFLVPWWNVLAVEWATRPDQKPPVESG